MTELETDLEKVCERALVPLGYELVALTFRREQAGFILRVFIDDTLANQSITTEDCARASRDISAALDVADLIDRPYALEVSSPGIERPLVRERDFERYAGRRASVRTRDAIDGRRNFSGTLHGAREGAVEIECDGRLFRLPLGEVVKANLKYEE